MKSDKILITGNAGYKKSIYESWMKNIEEETTKIFTPEQYQNGAEGFALFAEDYGLGASTSTCSAWDTPSLTKKSMMEMIQKAEELVSRKPEHFPFHAPLFENEYLTEHKQVKFLRCNKKKWSRVKRWNKNPKNFKDVPDYKIYYTKDFVTCHPDVAKALKNLQMKTKYIVGYEGEMHKLKYAGIDW